MAREPLQEGLQQQLLFEATIDDLRRPGQSPIDIENGLDSLSSLQRLSPQQAGMILELAGRDASLWARAVDPRRIIQVLAPSFSIYRELLEQRDDPEAMNQFTELSTTIVTEIAVSSPDAYRVTVVQPLKQGAFGEYGPTLVGVVKKLVSRWDREGTIWNDEYIDEENIVGMVEEVLALGDDTLIAGLRENAPSRLIYTGDPATEKSFSPRLKQLLQEARRGDAAETLRLVHRYLDAEEDEQEALRSRIVNGEFGDRVMVVDRIVSALMQSQDRLIPSERERIDQSAYDLWLDLLDKDPNDPRLRSITAEVINLEQYWNR